MGLCQRIRDEIFPALRHCSFVAIRDDKKPAEVVHSRRTLIARHRKRRAEQRVIQHLLRISNGMTPSA